MLQFLFLFQRPYLGNLQQRSLDLHLDSINVKVGENVEQDKPIGTIGATGRATGPHLDWRINLGKMRLDPQTSVTGQPN